MGASGEMRKRAVDQRAWNARFLISLLLVLATAACSPSWILEIRTADRGDLVYCARLTNQDEVVYTSINSIYIDPVEEYWRVQADGRLRVVRVITSPAVMGYYGIADFAPLDGKRMQASPQGLVYPEVRMLVDARGQQQLTVLSNKVDMYRMVPEATVVIIRARPASLGLGC